MPHICFEAYYVAYGFVGFVLVGIVIMTGKSYRFNDVVLAEG